MHKEISSPVAGNDICSGRALQGLLRGLEMGVRCCKRGLIATKLFPLSSDVILPFRAATQSTKSPTCVVIIFSVTRGGRFSGVLLLIFTLFLVLRRYSHPLNVSFERCISSGVVGLVRRWDSVGPEFHSRLGQKRFFSSKVSRSALGCTKPPFQWIPFLNGLGKRPGHKIDHSPPLPTREKPVQITGPRSPAVLHIFLSFSR